MGYTTTIVLLSLTKMLYPVCQTNILKFQIFYMFCICEKHIEIVLVFVFLASVKGVKNVDLKHFSFVFYLTPPLGAGRFWKRSFFTSPRHEKRRSKNDN